MSDVYLVNGDLVEQNRWVSGNEKTIQSIQIRLGRFRGEWFLDPSSGLPWMEWLGTRNLNPNTVLSQIRSEILRVEGVVSISRLEYVKSGTSFDIGADIVLASDQINQTVLGIVISGTGRVVVL
jgi:hypothetical protein